MKPIHIVFALLGLMAILWLVPKTARVVKEVADPTIVHDTIFYTETDTIIQKEVVRDTIKIPQQGTTKPFTTACNNLCVGCLYEILAIDKNPFRKGNQISPFGYNTDVVEVLAIREGWVKFSSRDDSDKLAGYLTTGFGYGIFDWYDCPCKDFKFLRRI